MNKELATIILKMTWDELDIFAERIVAIATDSSSGSTDERYISQCLLEDAKEARQ